MSSVKIKLFFCRSSHQGRVMHVCGQRHDIILHYLSYHGHMSMFAFWADATVVLETHFFILFYDLTTWTCDLQLETNVMWPPQCECGLSVTLKWLTHLLTLWPCVSITTILCLICAHPDTCRPNPGTFETRHFIYHLCLTALNWIRIRIVFIDKLI